jgi:polyisoprenoid-binding protein YceI
MRRRRRLLLFGIPVVLLGVFGAVLAFFLVRGGDEPPPPTLATVPQTAPAPGATTQPAGGTYAVARADGTFVGYRVREEFASFGVVDAVGRTEQVDGTARLAGRTVAQARIVADLSALRSDEARRDRALRNRGIQTATFPEATFELAEPARIAPPRGERARANVRGRLTLHGETRPVTAALQSQWNGDRLEVVGSAPISFDDFQIEPPDVAGFVTVSDRGRMEFRLLLAPETPAG